MPDFISTTKPKNAIIYLRVSTEEQVDNFSLGTQEEICRKEALRRGFEIVQVFREEGKSAKNIYGRPILIEMLEFCRRNKRHVSALFIYRLDRISRQTSDYLAIRKKLVECEIALLSATEPTGNSPTEKLVETMLAGFAQLDNDVRSERTKNGMRARFLSGLHIGGAPIGYLHENGYVTKDPVFFDKIKEAWELMATGSKTLLEMANIMTYWGVYQTLNGKKYPVTRGAASRIFHNKFYMGILISSRYPEEVRGQHTPMITEKQFYKVQAIIDGRNTNIAIPIAKRNKDNTDFPLRRIMQCGKCGFVLTGAWSKGRNCRYSYYFCRRRCGAPSVPTEEIEQTLITTLKEITPTRECLTLFFSLLRKEYMKRLTNLKKKNNTADTELTKLYALRQSIIEKNLSGVYSDQIFKEQNALIEDKIATIQLSKNDKVIQQYNLEEIILFVKEFFNDLGETYRNSNLTIKRIVLGSIFAEKLAWSYPGISNRQISPLYQCIRAFDNGGVALSDPSGLKAVQILASWERLRQVYQEPEEESNIV